jgi:ribosome-associated protein
MTVGGRRIITARDAACQIAGIEDDMKATNIVVLDIERISNFADMIVLCTGSSRVHLRAIVREVEKRMRERDIRPLAVEGLNGTGWVVLDYGDVVAHVFTDESRTYYNLERLWADAHPVRWQAKSSVRKRKKDAISP